MYARSLSDTAYTDCVEGDLGSSFDEEDALLAILGRACVLGISTPGLVEIMRLYVVILLHCDLWLVRGWSVNTSPG